VIDTHRTDLGVTRQGCHYIHEMIVTANRTCVLLASEDMITQRRRLTKPPGPRSVWPRRVLSPAILTRTASGPIVKAQSFHAKRWRLMIAFITYNSSLIPLLEGLCSSNPCRFELSVFWVFAGIKPTTSGLTVPVQWEDSGNPRLCHSCE